jgi:hypothetical protein
MNKILGETHTHWVSQILGTGYLQFQSPSGIGGLAQEYDNGNRLDILAINSEVQGSGQLREFIKQCKDVYSTICIWVVENPTLASALGRYGFTPEVEIRNDETVHGFRWDKQHEQPGTRPGSPDRTLPDNTGNAGSSLRKDAGQGGEDTSRGSW